MEPQGAVLPAATLPTVTVLEGACQTAARRLLPQDFPEAQGGGAAATVAAGVEEVGARVVTDAIHTPRTHPAPPPPADYVWTYRPVRINADAATAGPEGEQGIAIDLKGTMNFGPGPVTPPLAAVEIW